MSDVSVIIPFDPAGDAHRDRACDFLRDRYRRDGFETIVSGTLSTEPWAKGVAVHRGVESSSGEFLIVADADCVAKRETIAECLALVRGGTAWAMPHGPVVRMTEKETRRFLRGDAGSIRARQKFEGPPGGGIVVLPRSSYDATGGIDPRFVGWGGEDISWARALDTLAGPVVRLREPLLHLYHVPARPRLGRACPESEALAGRYFDAAGDPTAMRALVDEFRVPSREESR